MATASRPPYNAGVKAHDAPILAAMKVYGITHLLTFSAEDLTYDPDITVAALEHVPQT
jgi:hypothetical protein